MIFVLLILLVAVVLLWYGLYTAKDVDTCLSKELAAFEFKLDMYSETPTN